MDHSDTDILYMRRALQLAATSPLDTHPNPMVGAVIVADGRIIGEGYHRRCGEGHAEVNAIASVKDRSLLRRSTIYVTLEPCSHHGKTPPCAGLIIRSGIPRVVTGAGDPFEKVAGRGIAMLRDAGIEVIEGVLADESRELNRSFFTAHTTRRPYVTLKWAMSADRFMDRKRLPGQPAARFSTPLTSALVHRQRAMHDAIVTTAATVLADNPRLDVRLWDGPSPRKVVIDRHGLVTTEAAIFRNQGIAPLHYAPAPLPLPNVEHIPCSTGFSVEELLNDLYRRGITSVLVEAGPKMLQAFLDAGTWDTARIETSPTKLGSDGTAPAPEIMSAHTCIRTENHDGNTIAIIRR